MQQFSELVKLRQSCRNYDSARKVEQEKIDLCLEAARISPSACNTQPWFFTVVGGQKAREIGNLLMGGAKNSLTQDCPNYVVVSSVPANMPEASAIATNYRDFREIDIGLAVGQFCLQATELGLGTCILGWFDEEAIKKIVGAPQAFSISLVLALGYPKADDPLRRKPRKKKANMSALLGVE